MIHDIFLNLFDSVERIFNSNPVAWVLGLVLLSAAVAQEYQRVRSE